MSAGSRLGQLDALRALAVTLVLLHHQVPIPERVVGPAAAVLRGIQRAGWAGVDLFFVLSGFLVAGLLFREARERGDIRFGRFFLRRGLKIYPAFYLFLAASIAAELAWAGQVEASKVAAEALFVQSYFTPLWNHTWSLAVEEHFYIALPLVLLALLALGRGRHAPFAAVPGLFAAVAAIALALRIENGLSAPWRNSTHLFPTHLRIDALGFGVLLSWFEHHHGAALAAFVRRWRAALVAVSAALVAPVALCPIETSLFVQTAGLSLLYLGCGGFLLVALHGGSGGCASSRPARVLAALGRDSYSIYLWHMPARRWLVNLVRWSVPGEVHWLLLDLVYVAGALALGLGAARLVERPVLAWRDRRFPSLASGLRPPGPA